MPWNWRSGCGPTCVQRTARGGSTRPTSRSRAAGSTCTDSRGRTIDFRLSARRDAQAAKRFFRKALARPHTVNPRTITVDKNAAYPKAVADLKRDKRLWRFSKLRQIKYLNNIVEQDHRRIKRLVRPGLGFKRFRTAWRTLVGYEALAMMRKGQVKGIGGDDIVAQAAFVKSLFDVAA